jgi:hypothetical protein
MKNLWKNYSLGIILTALWLVSWVLQLVFQLPLEMNNAKEHGQEFQMSEFWISFLKDTFENWQSEFLQVLTFVILTKYFIFDGSKESKTRKELDDGK